MKQDQKSDLPSLNSLLHEIELLKRRIDRERKARQSAESLLESKSLELFNANQVLESLNKTLEKSVEVRTQTLLTLINNLHAGVLLNDENGRIVFVNEQFREIFKISLSNEELMGMDQRMATEMAKGLFVDPDKFTGIVDRCISTNQDVLSYELEMLNNRIIDCDFIPIGTEGDFVGHLWQIRDVTEQRRVQKKIQNSEEKYRGIIENMQLGLLEVDNEHTILRAYDSFCKMTGYKEEELLGKNAMTVLLPSDLKENMLREDTERSNGRQSIYETRILKKGGEEIWVLVSGAPIFDEHGVVTGSIGIHYDITRRKNLEEQLREARNQAEKARKAEKDFLANMSHEIRNPINAVIGMVNLLYDTKPTREQLELLDNIKLSSDVLLGLISGVLDISKIESGNFDLVERELDLRDTLTAIVDIASFKTSEKNIDIVLKLDDSINFKVLADLTVINQIFLNLINNAIKFTERGKIVVSGALLEQTEQTAQFIFAVKDTGIGIPKEKLDDIFQQFNQGDSQTKLKYGGTGLGLAIVKKLVGGYHGEIDVESYPGQGSIFQFTLQLALSKNEERAKVDFKVLANSNCHALIVEDNQINQQYLSGILKNWGVTYHVANNGQEALTWLSENTYDVILMDIRMPIMDGYETTIRIRSDHANINAKTPIIALTASALVDEKKKAISVGMNEHLSKPFTPDQLAYVFEQFGLANLVESYQENDLYSFSAKLNSQYLKEFYAQDFSRAKLMFEIFLNSIDAEMEKLAQYLKDENWEKFSKQAHKIKPNFAMVGLSEISEIMQLYEKAFDLENIRPRILHEFSLTLQKFRKGRNIVKKELPKIPQV